MKTDHFFHKFFADFPETVALLLGYDSYPNPVYEAIDVKETELRIDGVLKLSSNFHILVEIYFYHEADAFRKMVKEALIYEHQNPKIQVERVIFFADETLQPPAAWLQPLIDTQQIKVFYLASLLPQITNPTAELDLLNLTVSAENLENDRQLVRHFLTVKNEEPPEKQKKLVELCKTLLRYKYRKLTYSEIRMMLEIKDFPEFDFKESVLYKTTLEAVKEEYKLEGRLEGRLEGKLEGKLQDKLETTHRLAAAGIPPEQIAVFVDLPLAAVLEELNKT